MTDSSGLAVEGVSAWDDGGDPSVCGIRIQEMEDRCWAGSSSSANSGVTEGSHDEDHDDLNSAAWTADLKFSEAVIFGHDSIYWIAAEVHLR